VPTFKYEAISGAGERISGQLHSASEQAALADLEARSLTPIRISEKSEAGHGRRLFRGVSVRALATAYTQLSDLLRAGVPLLRSLTLLSQRRSNPRLGACFEELTRQVADGAELAVAMAERPDIFPKIHIAMVAAGEKGGFLEVVLSRLGRFLERQADLRTKLFGNLLYPAILVFVGAGVLIAVFGYLVPKFRPMFAKLEEAGDLPGITRFVLGLSSLVSDYWLITIAFLALCVGASILLLRRPAVRLSLARAQLFAPFFGPLFRAIAAARFCRILGTLLANAIPLLTALSISRDAAGNPILAATIDEATEAVRQGDPLHRALGVSGCFEADVVEMIAVGESANNLDEVLVTIAETTERRIDTMATTAVRLVEPLLLLALAVVVAIVAIALIVPISRMSGLA
jgi:general secretion pathway protein F/type IV pilus assembly protein PilC